MQLIRDKTIAKYDYLSSSKPVAKGKFIYLGDDKFYVRGVTYGPFRPDDSGCEYKNPSVVDSDFHKMVTNNINTIRTYTAPPPWILDIALKHGLKVMVGLLGTHHTAFIDQEELVSKIRKRVLEDLQNCKGHPAILCYSIGNEIPASIVRWYGRKRVQNYLESMYNLVKNVDPDSLITYVNYPTTEYLQLPFLDFISFNVYLEDESALSKYLAKLQTLSGEKPLVLAEIGLDSIRNGEDQQAKSISWQIKNAFMSGCAGAIVFSWTDEWYRGGEEIHDWDFGITTRDRSPKPALESVRNLFAEIPFNSDLSWPGISIIICTYNGSQTIEESLEFISKIDYPNYEVIVVNDGSTDRTLEIVSHYVDEFGFRLITTENLGLSNARNVGMHSAKNDIIAYIDDDAYPDPQWLKYLAFDFMRTEYAAIGGPNIPPGNDGFIAQCISKSPGNPLPVLITDQEAEHLTGCNMAFRKSIVQEVGGFDTTFRIAGDDVDICWNLIKSGYKLGYSPSAMVWHHRRNSIRTYLKQQYNYGRAESLLEKKWPEKFSPEGNANWIGKMYGPALSSLGSRIYHGTWGTAPFQSLYQRDYGTLNACLLMPEWYLIIVILLFLSIFSFIWKPLLLVLPLLGASVLMPIIGAFRSARNSGKELHFQSDIEKVKFIIFTSALHLAQPISRLYGRIREGLTPWRRPKNSKFSFPWPRVRSFWNENWHSTESRLELIENKIKEEGYVVSRGSNFDRWDLEIRGGLLGSTRLLMASEEHEHGKQMTKFKCWPNVSLKVILIILTSVFITILAGLEKSLTACLFFALFTVCVLYITIADCSCATYMALKALKTQEEIGTENGHIKKLAKKLATKVRGS